VITPKHPELGLVLMAASWPQLDVDTIRREAAARACLGRVDDFLSAQGRQANNRSTWVRRIGKTAKNDVCVRSISRRRRRHE
jgi:hypothetical protein